MVDGNPGSGLLPFTEMPKPTPHAADAPADKAASKPSKGLTYADSGVDIDAGDRFAGSIQGLMRRTFGTRASAQAIARALGLRRRKIVHAARVWRSGR